VAFATRTALPSLAVGLVLALLLAACGSDTVDVRDVEPPASVPPRDAHLADGGWPETAAWIRRENEAGRPVLVNIFASWCLPCERELPLLLDAAADNPDIAFLGIDHLDQRDDAERFVAEMAVSFPTIYDIAGDVAFALEARGMPTTVVFDVDGRLAGHRTGELTRGSLEELLDEVR
jgi:thiol-disulfide isomerase/thioredoxin